MAKPFVPKEKLSKKAKRELDRKKRQLWAISPVTRRSENRKRDDRKRRYRIDDDGTASFFYSFGSPPRCAGSSCHSTRSSAQGRSCSSVLAGSSHARASASATSTGMRSWMKRMASVAGRVSTTNSGSAPGRSR